VNLETIMKKTQDLHVLEFVSLPPPKEMAGEFPITDEISLTIEECRNGIKRLLRGKDDRFLIITGPCSIHDEEAALEYAERLNRLRQEVEDRILLVMRVYFEKPRTTIGWKGLISDPCLDGTGDMPLGLRKARSLLLKITEMGLPAATEFLDPFVPQYIADLICWAAIGARTTESQTHREMASGLSMPVGFKNSTEGNSGIALDAMQSARFQHGFLGMTEEGRVAIVKTCGNIWGHIILRGGRLEPNYDRESVRQTLHALEKRNLPQYIMVDCSHANSRKQYENQPMVFNDVLQQRLDGNKTLLGVMIESHLHEGNQKIHEDISQLEYGVSITDACIDWETTENLIRSAYKRLKTEA